MPKSLVDGLHLEDNPAMNQTYSLTLRHVSLVNEMHAGLAGNQGGRNRVSKGAIVRKAIERLAALPAEDLAALFADEVVLDIRRHPGFVRANTAREEAGLSLTGAGRLSGAFPR